MVKYKIGSADNNMKNLKYKIGFADGLKLQKGRVIKKIRETLNDKRGWRRMGYTFQENETDNFNFDFVIYFTTNNYIEKVCNFTGLSCADTSSNIIYINTENWRRGSKLSGLNKDDYRTYIINHEVGHLLGRDHSTCGKGGTRVPVMVQQTLGIGNCKPNPWPLHWE